jgi:pyruvate dehydrogenase E1 component alpha subunit
MTFRFFGHNFGDNDAYIPKDMKAEAMANDPVPRFRKMLIDDGIATETELAAMEADIEAQISAAVEFALASPWPEPDDLRHDVFAEEVLP